ncbi:hypothetical protein DFH06DRAFT_1168354 [Mycena polygramma]|nr:hypothetical protein DFH06DRAFT_1168354 [Mycena polygramma]
MDRSLLHRQLPQVREPGSGPTGPSTSQFISLEVNPEDRNDNEGSTATASDFVKKLYKILEDRSDQDIISWGTREDCFVVKDVTEFAKSLLPRMFKHSNFASFVRQLNKYDFHKVKTMDGDEGEETWTFRHPKFRAGGRDALDSIKRKAPGRRKSNGSALPPTVSPSGSGSGANNPSQDDSETSRLATMQAELASLGSAHEEVLSHVRNLEKNYREVFLQMLGFQRTIAQQDGLMQNLMQYFSMRDPVGEIGQGQSSNNNTPSIDWGADNPFLFMQSPETQRLLDKSFAGTDVAQATLSHISDIARRAGAGGRSPFIAGDEASSVDDSRSTRRGSSDAMRPVDMVAQIQEVQAQRERLLLNTPPLPLLGNAPSPSPSTSTTKATASPESGDAEEEMVVPTPTTSELGLGGSDAWGMDTAHTGLEVYTVGHLMPRDNSSSSYTDSQGNHQWGYGGAFADDHETSQSYGSGSSSGTGGGGSPETSTSKSTLRVRRAAFVPGWAVPPRVLLVDDDAVSRMLSSKFLQVFGCAIDVAVDGVSAVNKMNFEKYDLVLMDIVMPKLDGVSATSMIRKFDPRTPIISMTGNARPSDIMSYYSSGMNDVLSKPFSKQGLFDMLEKHLTHLTVMNEQMSLMRNVPSPLGLPPLNDAGFDGALQRGAASWFDSRDNNSPDEDQRMNLLAGMGVSDEQYNFMLSDMLSTDGFDLGAKRPRDGGEGDLDGHDSKRSRFEEL